MNILYLTNLYPPVVSGSSVQSRSLALHVAAKGHGVVIITARLDRDMPDYEERNGVHIYRLPCFRLPKMNIALNFPWLNALTFPGNFARALRIAAKHEIDLVHVHNHMFDAAFLGRRVSRKLGKPMVVTLHTVINHLQKIYNALLVPIDRYFLGKLIVRPVAKIICPDENIRTYLQDRFARTDGVLIPYGIDLPETSDPVIRTELISKYGLQKRRMMLSVGHLHALRNRVTLIKALPDVVRQYPDFLLIIVGAVTDGRAATLVRELKLENHVAFAGTQPRAVVRELHDLCLFEGMWLDQDENGMNSLGVAGMEAMFMGKALISSSNINAFGPGLLKNGENIYCEPHLNVEKVRSILLNLLNHPQQAETVGRQARKLAMEIFSWDASVGKTLDVYSSLVQERMPCPVAEAA